MKKLLAMLLVGATCFSLSACGEKDGTVVSASLSSPVPDHSNGTDVEAGEWGMAQNLPRK